MDISNKFSLVDFLAFFFPGILGTLGIFFILLFTPLNSLLVQIKFDISFAILFFSLSYVLGVILSGIAEIFIKVKFVKKPKSLVCIPEYQKELLAALNDILGKSENRAEKWALESFYLCRSLVIEFMPHLGDFIQRQSSLRQLRLNLIPTIVLWLIAGIIWGINLLISQMQVWGIIVIVSSILIAGLIIFTLLNRMQNNEEREVREVQSAFLAGYKAGIFTKAKKG